MTGTAPSEEAAERPRRSFAPGTHQTHRESLLRFGALVLLLVGYFAYMTWTRDAATGLWVSLLSWSFFVLCTPIADGGFIVAFPVRLLLGVRMFVTQLVVWALALGVNVLALSIAPDRYAESKLTELLRSILTTPWPYWSILVISLAGTLLSIWFGDEMIDVTTHVERKKHHRHGFVYRTLLVAGLASLTIAMYYLLLSNLGIETPDSA